MIVKFDTFGVLKTDEEDVGAATETVESITCWLGITYDGTMGWWVWKTVVDCIIGGNAGWGIEDNGTVDDNTLGTGVAVATGITSGVGGHG